MRLAEQANRVFEVRAANVADPKGQKWASPDDRPMPFAMSGQISRRRQDASPRGRPGAAALTGRRLRVFQTMLEIIVRIATLYSVVEPAWTPKSLAALGPKTWPLDRPESSP